MRSRSRQSEAAAIAPARTLPVRRRRFAAGPAIAVPRVRSQIAGPAGNSMHPKRTDL